MKLYLVRHGESIANSQRKHQGDSYDTDLTELGFEQAKKLANRLKEFNFDIIYTSHLKRAKQTADEINLFHNKEIIVNKKLKERDNGDFSGKVWTEELWKGMIGDKMNIKAPNGENRIDQYNRVKPIIDKILKLNKDILIVSHGGTIKSILASLFPEKNLEEIHKLYKTGNTCLYKIEVQNKEAKIIIENCTKHLDK
jgi:broad specificity phosphatase PhoE